MMTVAEEACIGSILVSANTGIVKKEGTATQAGVPEIDTPGSGTHVIHVHVVAG